MNETLAVPDESLQSAAAGADGADAIDAADLGNSADSADSADSAVAADAPYAGDAGDAANTANAAAKEPEAPDAPDALGAPGTPVTAALPPPGDLSPAACAARLAELFPALFGAAVPQPLKLRIQVDVQQRAPGVFTRKALSLFLQRYTTTTAYLKALAQAPERVDLDGQAAGPVSDEHREAAVTELQRRRALHDERRAAQREAERQARNRLQEEARRNRQAEGPPPSVPTAGEPAQAVPRPARGTEGPSPRNRPPRHPAREAAPTTPAEGRARGEREARPPREREARPPREREVRSPREHEARPPVQEAPRRMDPAESPALSERAALLRAFETTTLTRANFLALKGMSEADLDAALAQARQDREQQPQRPRPSSAAHPRAEQGPRSAPRHSPGGGGRPRGDKPPR